MLGAEVPQFVHSESFRKEMFARIRQIAEQSEVSPTHLKHLCYLIWARDEEKGHEDEDLEDKVLPDQDNPVIRLQVGDPYDNFVEITFLDEIEPMTGETLRLSSNDGILEWHLGVTEKPLNPDECAKVARTIFTAYKDSLEAA